MGLSSGTNLQYGVGREMRVFSCAVHHFATVLFFELPREGIGGEEGSLVQSNLL